MIGRTKYLPGILLIVSGCSLAIGCSRDPVVREQKFLAQGNRDKAFRRRNRQGVIARIADGAFLRVHYPSVKLLATTFAAEFRLKSIKGIGVAVPPSYLEPWAQRHPQLLRVCEQVDSWTARCPGIRVLGDHVLVRLEREA